MTSAERGETESLLFCHGSGYDASPKKRAKTTERLNLRDRYDELRTLASQHEALLYEKLSDGAVQCNLCLRRCLIQEGASGFCRARANDGGRLLSLAYGRVASQAISPAERKPLYHFYPGETMLSIGTLGCNFRCPGCQNWELAHSPVAGEVDLLPYVPPEELVGLALRHGCMGISWTYNEPTIWLEYTLDGAKLAKQRGLMTNYVTNGGIALDGLDLIGPYLDAYRVDLKGFSEETYRRAANFPHASGVFEAAARAKRHHGLHVECVTNVIPGHNDSTEELRAIARWMVSQLGADTPWHLTRFHPHHQLRRLAFTPVRTLEQAREAAKEAGLRYVYIGNVPGHPGDNTCCHACGETLITRDGFTIVGNRIEGGRCPTCREVIPGRFR